MPTRARMALGGAGAGALLLIIVWLVALHVGAAERADQSIFRGFAGLRGGHVSGAARFIADLCDPKPFVCFAAAVVVIALVRRRPSSAVGAAAILLGASETTQLLKPLLAEPRAHWLLAGPAPVGPGSWPSGHATAAMSLALSAVLVAPARLRPAVAALGAAFAVAVSYSFLTLGWHYPSDVLGGFLVATIWALLVIAALISWRAHRASQPGSEERERASLSETLAPSLATLAGALGLLALIALVRPHEVVLYSEAHRAFVIGAAAIAALGLVLSTGVLLVVRR